MGEAMLSTNVADRLCSVSVDRHSPVGHGICLDHTRLGLEGDMADQLQGQGAPVGVLIKG